MTEIVAERDVPKQERVKVVLFAIFKTGYPSLKENIAEQTHHSGTLSGQKVFTPLVSFGFMIFILIYFPCVAVIAAIKKEANWGWAIFTMVYTTVIAWVLSFAIYQIGSLII